MLILCEKPSVAKDFACSLGAKPKKGYFEGDNCIITYCVGHLFELALPQAYNPRYKNWVLSDLPIIPDNFIYQELHSTKEQAKIVIDLLRKHKTSEVLIATDAGREGELIARIAMLMAGVVDIKKFKRFWVSEALTPLVIQKGIEESKPLSEYNTLSAQGFARQKSDWLVGMNISRYMSIGNPPPPFSVGRVQTAVLSVIASRNNEIKNFTPIPFKELEASVSSKDGVIIKSLLVNPNTGKTAFLAQDENYLLDAHKSSNNLTIESCDVQSQEKRQKPEKLLNLTALQKLGFKRFGYKPEKTLEIAQSLYETHKCLSYPRTPSRVMGDNNVSLFKEKFELLAKIGHSYFCDPSLICASNKHIFDSSKLEDHHALIPLGPIPANANGEEQNIFNLVLSNFFTVCMPDYIYNQKTLTFHAGTYNFVSSLREVIQLGWKEVSKDEEETDDIQVAKFDENGCFFSGFKILTKTTEPKKEFDISSLLAFMEKPKEEGESKLSGLGTPATRAEIIKTLFAREYIIEEKKKLFATKRGHYLLDQLSLCKNLSKLADVSHTTEWEQKLSSDPEAFEAEIKKFITDCIDHNSKRDIFPKKPLGQCPLCKKDVVQNNRGYGCSGYQDIPKCAFFIGNTVANAAVSPDDVSLLLIGQKTKIKKCKNKDGKPFEAALFIECGKVTFLFNK